MKLAILYQQSEPPGPCKPKRHRFMHRRGAPNKKALSFTLNALYGCGDRTWTCDLRVTSHKASPCLPLRNIVAYACLERIAMLLISSPQRHALICHRQRRTVSPQRAPLIVLITRQKKNCHKRQFLNGCGDRTWTCDLRVMSPTSYQLLYPAILSCALFQSA